MTSEIKEEVMALAKQAENTELNKLPSVLLYLSDFLDSLFDEADLLEEATVLVWTTSLPGQLLRVLKSDFQGKRGWTVAETLCMCLYDICEASNAEKGLQKIGTNLPETMISLACRAPDSSVQNSILETLHSLVYRYDCVCLGVSKSSSMIPALIERLHGKGKSSRLSVIRILHEILKKYPVFLCRDSIDDRGRCNSHIANNVAQIFVNLYNHSDLLVEILPFLILLCQKIPENVFFFKNSYLYQKIIKILESLIVSSSKKDIHELSIKFLTILNSDDKKEKEKKIFSAVNDDEKKMAVENSALLIQKMYRGFIQSKKYSMKISSAIIIQRWWRQKLSVINADRIKLAREMAKTKEILNSKKEKSRYDKERKLTFLAATPSLFVTPFLSHQKQNAARIIQKAWRNALSVRYIRKLAIKRQKENAATTIQRAFRSAKNRDRLAITAKHELKFLDLKISNANLNADQSTYKMKNILTINNNNNNKGNNNEEENDEEISSEGLSKARVDFHMERIKDDIEASKLRARTRGCSEKGLEKLAAELLDRRRNRREIVWRNRIHQGEILKQTQDDLLVLKDISELKSLNENISRLNTLILDQEACKIAKAEHLHAIGKDISCWWRLDQYNDYKL